jgi:hypothetical protein
MAEVRELAWDNGLVEEQVDRDGVFAAAVFSPDRAYRYLLRRTWQPDTEPMLFLMLNPSTADALTDDQTIRRCVHYARRQGYGGVSVANLCAWRATDPRALVDHPDPVGPLNWQVLTTLAMRDPGRIIVAAWGVVHPSLRIIADQVADLFLERGHNLWRLGALTVNGCPRHPARLGNDVPLVQHRTGRAVQPPDLLAPLTEASLKPCDAGGMCPRLVTFGVKFCCGPCANGWESTPRHEANHTEFCDQRWAERQHLAAPARG